MRCNYACGRAEHLISRRHFLGDAAVGVGAGVGLGAGLGLAGLTVPAVSAELARKERQVLVIWLAGGASQLETWDPKPRTDTGGPFRSIETSVPGIRISELLPQTAIRCTVWPSCAASTRTKTTTARALSDAHRPAPDAGGGLSASRLGAWPGICRSSTTPCRATFTSRPAAAARDRARRPFWDPSTTPSISVMAARRPIQRRTRRCRAGGLRQAGNAHALQRPFRPPPPDRGDGSLYRHLRSGQQLMARREVFDVSREPAKELDRYGSHDFGRHCLLARRLLEAGVTFVQVSTPTTTRTTKISTSISSKSASSTAVRDSDRRPGGAGALEHTLVVVMSEFGRTPQINYLYGRDHWGNGLVICLAGAGIKRACRGQDQPPWHRDR